MLLDVDNIRRDWRLRSIDFGDE